MCFQQSAIIYYQVECQSWILIADVLGLLLAQAAKAMTPSKWIHSSTPGLSLKCWIFGRHWVNLVYAEGVQRELLRARRRRWAMCVKTMMCRREHVTNGVRDPSLSPPLLEFIWDAWVAMTYRLACLFSERVEQVFCLSISHWVADYHQLQYKSKWGFKMLELLRYG